MTPIENAIAVLGGQSAAARTLKLSGYQVAQQWIAQGRVPADYCPRIESLTGVRCEDLNDRVEWSLIRGTAPAGTTDHAAQLRAAIQQTREVFKNELAASDAMRYLEALLDTNAFFASAAVPAQTGITAGAAARAGGDQAEVDQYIHEFTYEPADKVRDRMLELATEVANARARVDQYKLEVQLMNDDRETLIADLRGVKARNVELERQVLTLFGPAAGAPVFACPGTADSKDSLSKLFAAWERVGGERLADSGRIADEAGRRAFVESALPYIECAQDLRHVLGMPQSAATDKFSVAAGGANASIAEETFTGAGAAPVAGVADQAAAAMAAESAQKLADAERSVAKKAVAADVDPLGVLSREANGLSNKLTVPVDVALQLLVLAELRGLRSDYATVRLPESAAQVGERIGVAGVRDAISRASAELRR